MFTYTNTDENNRCAYFSHRKIYWLFRKKTSSMQVWVVLNYTSRNVIKLYVLDSNRAVNKLKYMNNWTIYIDLHTQSSGTISHFQYCSTKS